MRKGLLISTMLVSVAGLGMSAEAANQCLQTPSCEALGYTQTSCVDNNGVKCPFGNKYFCVCPAKYAYSCSGTGYTGGKGTACGGKYTECTCASGYVWENGSCVQNAAVWGQCTGYAGKKCKIGDILFSDGTCAADKVTGKTPIAVVVYISSEGCAQAMSLIPAGGPYVYYRWAMQLIDVENLPNSSSDEASQDFASCENSKIIMAAGDKNQHPAVWAAHEYSTEGTKAGDWCLPAAGVFASYYNNKDTVNAGFNRAGGDVISDYYTSWSSTEYNYHTAWYSYFYWSPGIWKNENKGGEFRVRPVIEF